MPSGRTRQFDEDEALDRAMEVFWRRGYEGATLPELTAAMGINRPSLYAAFGNKEQLFRKALDRYRSGPVAFVREALKEPTARGVAEGLFRGVVRLLDDPANPRLHGRAGGAGVRGGGRADPAGTGRAAGAAVAAIRERFEQAVREGDLPEGRIARRSPATWPRSCTAWSFRRRAVQPRSCGRLRSWPCRRGLRTNP